MQTNGSKSELNCRTCNADVAVTPEGLAAGFDGKARRFDDVEYLTDDILLKQLTEDNFADAVGSP